MLKLLTEEMIPHLAPDEKISVWFTGHSRESKLESSKLLRN